jgi:hypothetical protein
MHVRVILGSVVSLRLEPLRIKPLQQLDGFIHLARGVASIISRLVGHKECPHPLGERLIGHVSS